MLIATHSCCCSCRSAPARLCVVVPQKSSPRSTTTTATAVSNGGSRGTIRAAAAASLVVIRRRSTNTGAGGGQPSKSLFRLSSSSLSSSASSNTYRIIRFDTHHVWRRRIHNSGNGGRRSNDEDDHEEPVDFDDPSAPSKQYHERTNEEWWALIENLSSSPTTTATAAANANEEEATTPPAATGPSFTCEDVRDAEACIRWLTANQKRKQEGGDEKVKNPTVACFRIFERVATEIHNQPSLLHHLPGWYSWSTESSSSSTATTSTTRPSNARGRPRATSLLNSVLNFWRQSITTARDISELPGPELVLDYVHSVLARNLHVPVDAPSYTEIMTAAVALSGRPKPLGLPYWYGADFCENVLKFLLHRVKDNKQDRGADEHGERSLTATPKATRPDVVMFTTAVRAWAKSGRVDAAPRAWKLLDHFVHLYDARVVSSSPNTVAYNTLLSALVAKPTKGLGASSRQSKVDLLQKRIVWMQEADLVFLSMTRRPYRTVTPDNCTYRILIFGWANLSAELRKVQMPHGAAIDRAISLLQEMADLDDDSNIQLEASNYSKVINSLVSYQRENTMRHLDYEKAEEVYLSLVRLSTTTDRKILFSDLRIVRVIILMYAETSRPALADDLLTLLEKEAISQNDDSIAGNPFHYHGVLQAWLCDAKVHCRSGAQESAVASVEAAENLVRRMIQRAKKASTGLYLPNDVEAQEVAELWRKYEQPARAIAFEQGLK
jgi:hypothetical protein